MLRDDIREFVSFTGCKILNEMLEKAQEWEMELDFSTKRKPEQRQAAGVKAKKPKTPGTSSRGQQGQVRCVKCSRVHGRAFRITGTICYA